MRVEFTVPMEGPRTTLHPKGVSRRPCSQEEVSDAEGATLIERGMAFAVDDDGYPIKVTSAEHQARQADQADQVEAAANRQAPVERAVTQPAKPVERAVSQPPPAKPSAPKGAGATGGVTGGKAKAKA